jgi:putative transposase
MSYIQGFLVAVPKANKQAYLVHCPLRTGPLEAGVFRYVFLAGEERIRMKASRFTEAQKAFIVKQGEEGTPVAEICRKAGISQATYFNWKKRYGGLLPDEMRRLKAIEDENGRLKKIVADLTLDREMVSL